MYFQILVALTLTAITVLIHAIGTTMALRRMTRHIHTGSGQGTLEAITPIVVLVGSLLILSVVEILVWATWFVLKGDLPDFETAAYFSFTSYTTVGYGDVVLQPGSRLLGPIEAAVGVLMFGWSTSVLVAAIGRVAAATGVAFHPESR